MGQFTRWTQYLNGFLEHHGVPSFLSNVTDDANLDADVNEWAQVLYA